MRTQQFIQSHEGFKYSAGHNHNKDLGSAVLVSVVGISNAPNLGHWPKLLLTMSRYWPHLDFPSAALEMA